VRRRVRKRVTLGAQVAGINFLLTENMAAYGELKYVFFGWDGFGFAVGLYF